VGVSVVNALSQHLEVKVRGLVDSERVFTEQLRLVWLECVRGPARCGRQRGEFTEPAPRSQGAWLSEQ
jgi:hypothetical protein